MHELDAMAPRHAHFATALQERRTVLLGMWLFVATEVMMFGGLFMGLIVYRVTMPEAMSAASRHLDMVLGGGNTAVLLTSSLTMALAVLALRHGRQGATLLALAATAGLGALFLGVKLLEYAREHAEGLIPHLGPAFPLEQPGTQLFFNLYFAATGLHALHLGIGIALVAGLMLRLTLRSEDRCARQIRTECTGLYWHFVDIVWVFLYPALYLAGR